MLLEKLLPSERIPSSLFDDTRPASALTADVNFFASQLDAPARSIDTAPRAEIPGLVAHASDHLINSTNELSKSLLAFSKNNGNDAMHKYTTHLSTTLLTSHVLVKTVGKTAQCIDKICNLQ